MTPFERAIHRSLQRDAHTLGDDDGPETIEGWDSHAHLELLSALEEGYGITFTIDEQLELGTLGAIKTALRGRGVEL